MYSLYYFCKTNLVRVDERKERHFGCWDDTPDAMLGCEISESGSLGSLWALDDEVILCLGLRHVTYQNHFLETPIC